MSYSTIIGVLRSFTDPRMYVGLICYGLSQGLENAGVVNITNAIALKIICASFCVGIFVNNIRNDKSSLKAIISDPRKRLAYLKKKIKSIDSHIIILDGEKKLFSDAIVPGPGFKKAVQLNNLYRKRKKITREMQVVNYHLVKRKKRPARIRRVNVGVEGATEVEIREIPMENSGVKVGKRYS